MGYKGLQSLAIIHKFLSQTQSFVFVISGSRNPAYSHVQIIFTQPNNRNQIIDKG